MRWTNEPKTTTRLGNYYNALLPVDRVPGVPDIVSVHLNILVLQVLSNSGKFLVRQSRSAAPVASPQQPLELRAHRLSAQLLVCGALPVHPPARRTFIG